MWKWTVLAGLWACGSDDVPPIVTDTDTTVAPPVVAEVGPTLSPEQAYEASVLSVTWPEAETDEITWTWWVNGTSIAASGGELTGADFDRDDEVWVEGLPAAGPFVDTVGQSASVVVRNTVPEAAEPPVIQPEVLEAGMSAECVPSKATDDDGDGVTWDVRWWQNGQVLKSADLVLPESELLAGDELVCGLSPNDGTDVGAERLSEQRIVGVAQGYATELEAQEPMLWWPFDDVVPGLIEAWDANGIGVEPDSGAVF
jgi:hypothetical protein